MSVNIPSLSGLALLAIGAGAQQAGAAITYNTAGVDCPYTESRNNRSIQMTSQASWSCTGTLRVVSANGIPDHSVGVFPNSGNPNTISTQSVSQTLTTQPSYTGTATNVTILGYALNGVKFDPGTAQTCTTDCGNNGADSSGTWRIEALGQNYFDLGTDFNNAHVQPNGAYHYHGMPEGVLKQTGFTTSATLSDKYKTGPNGNTGTPNTMTLVGWAMDGFPIYARYAYRLRNDATGGVAVMRSSWRLSSTISTGRPSVSIAPLGTFTSDYVYTARSGDLDECNGRIGVTPEFPKGIYYYVITDTFPFAPRCVKGAVQIQPPPPPPPA